MAGEIRNPADDPLRFAHDLGHCEVNAAKARAQSMRMERMYRRMRATVLIGIEGRSADEREARALTDGRVMQAEDEWITAEREAQVVMARRDAMRVVWECYRTMESSRREELKRGL